MTKAASAKACEHPERLKGKPGECSREQVKKCHGEGGGHSCLEKK
jgi:ArsR family transcriptional regulator, arsenate/arsenite/antimonite-responsive transcriptional repressor